MFLLEYHSGVIRLGTADLAVMLDPFEVADDTCDTALWVLNESCPVLSLDLWWLIDQVLLLEVIYFWLDTNVRRYDSCPFRLHVR